MTVDSGPIPAPFDDENNDCPKRGVALSHMRIPYITVPTCQFCDVRLVLGRTTDGNLTPPNTEMPTFDVAARLRQLGMMPGGSQETKAESSGLDSGPWTDDNHPDASSGPLTMPPPSIYRHPVDAEAVPLHPTGTMLIPHAHTIIEEWTVERKNLAARHIDRWHQR